MKNPFRTPTPKELAAAQLMAAERDLLAAHSALEHYSAQVDMLQKRIDRLRQHAAPDLVITAIPRSLRKEAA